MENLLIIVHYIKIVFIFLDVVFLVFFIYSLKKAWKFRPHLSIESHETQTTLPERSVIAAQWKTIMRKFSSGVLGDMKIALLEADRLVDSVLQLSGYTGEHLADRIEKLSVRDDLTTIDGLWKAHRLRNEIVHSVDFEAAPDQMRSAMAGYEAFLREANVFSDEDLK